MNICILLEYSVKTLGSLKCFNPMLSFFLIKNWYLSSYGSFAYKHILSISGWLFIKFSNAFVFPDPEPPIINILYGWSEIYGQLELCFLLFSLVYIYQCLSFIICIILLFLLYLFPSKSCDTIMVFLLSLWYFSCIYSLQSFVTQL